MKIKTIFTILFYLFLTTISFAQNNNYEQFLLKKSQTLDLANNEKWLNMVYYQKNIFGNYESIFDSSNFFLAKDGKANPKNELEATIKGFFSNDFLPFKNVFNSKQTVQCAFKGRYEWLKKELNFDTKKLPEQKCTDFNKWYQDINPKSATLIFSSSYLNNPASMFGHTFLLINNQNSRITSNSLNYSASTKETNGVIFAYKGIFGLYQGNFSLMPYYKMIKKYNNFENRDLWEYDLNLRASELREILTNLWEINNNHANYYFFTENCSYLLLKLLKIIRPQIKDTNKISKWIIPSDTVINIAKVPNLIKSVKYRPSRASRINHIIKNGQNDLVKIAHKIAKNIDLSKKEAEIFNNLSINDKKLTYDLAYEYLQYDFNKQSDKEKTQDRNNMAKLSLDILEKRSKLTGTTKLPKMPTPKSNALLAHNPKRLFASYGYSKIRKDFIQLDLRPAYHDLMDDDAGFLKGASINVFDISARYFNNNDKLELNYFDLIDIKSYSPRNLLFKPISWELNIGAKQLYFGKEDFDVAANANLAFGFNFEPIKNTNISLLLANQNYYGKHVEEKNIHSLGPKLNIISNLTNKLKLNFNIGHNSFIDRNNYSYTQYQIGQNYTLSKNLSFKISYERKDFRYYQDDNIFNVGMNFYF